MQLLSEEVQNLVRIRNWEVLISVIIFLQRPRKKPKKTRSQKHRERMLAIHPFCKYCGIGLDFQTSTIDHVIPFSKGGTWAKENLVLACEKCNREKGSNTPL